MDRLKNLLVNGCSFLNHRHTDEIDLYLSPAELVKEHGKFKHMDNFARGGRGNDRILSTTITHFEMFPERKKDTFVLIGWSSALRISYCGERGSPRFLEEHRQHTCLHPGERGRHNQRHCQGEGT